MDYNYHTHTFRCQHASGTEREYIESALAAGITKIGFSEHIPFRFQYIHAPYRLRGGNGRCVCDNCNP